MRRRHDGHHPPRPSESGFALPIAIGMGLIMFLIGIVMIVRSHSDRLNATSQTASARSLAAAEAGLSKLQGFLNRYRALATYPANGSVSWVNPGATIENLYADCDTTPGDLNAFRDQHFPNGTDWPDVDADDASQGEYRLFNYVYGGTSGQTGAAGVLTVQGRVNAGTPNEAVSQIAVEVPVNTRQGRIPGIWVMDRVDGLSAPATVAADVMGPCGGTLDAAVTGNAMVIRSRMAIPPLPPQPADASNITDLDTIVTSLPSGDDDDDDDTTNATAASPPSLTLPNSTQHPIVNGVYHYSISTLNRSITVTGGGTVYLWVSGNIDLTNQKIIRQDCSGSAQNCSPLKLRIFGTSANGTMTLDESTVVCDALFHAPTYEVTFQTGGTVSNGCATNSVPLKTTSAYWVKSWNGGTGSVQLAPPQATWLDAAVPLLPQLAPFSRWETQAVQED